MQKLIMTIYYKDDVEIDPVLIEDFIRDNYSTLHVDADIKVADESELSTLIEREL